MKIRKCKGRCKRKLSINNFLELSPITDLRYNICIDCMIQQENITLNLFKTNQMETTDKGTRNFNQANDLKRLETYLKTFKPNGKKVTNKSIADELGTNVNTLLSWKLKEVKLPNGLSVGEAITKIKKMNNQKSEKMENQKEAITATENAQEVSNVQQAKTLPNLSDLALEIQSEIKSVSSQLIALNNKLNTCLELIKIEQERQLEKEISLDEFMVTNPDIDFLQASIFKKIIMDINGQEIGVGMYNEKEVDLYKFELLDRVSKPFRNTKLQSAQ